MKPLKPKSDKYAKLYEKAQPSKEPLFGQWRVEMLTGPFPDLTLIGHVKVFKGDHGQNISGFSWGDFDIEYLADYTLLDYRDGRIKDRIRKVRDGYYIGEFYLFDNFTGYFSLTRS